MVRMDDAMKKIYLLLAATLLLSSCVTTQRRVGEVSVTTASETTKENKVSGTGKKADVNKEPSKTSGIVVDNKDLVILEKMVKAVETYVLKNDKRSFSALCKDKRFDCYVNDKFYPAGKKKTSRNVPPYALGSKMGLQGETRVQIRYEFYP